MVRGVSIISNTLGSWNRYDRIFRKEKFTYLLHNVITFTTANVIVLFNKPTLVMSHNKTLAAQLYRFLS